MRLIDSEAALADGVAALARLDPSISRAVEGGLVPPLRRRLPGFAGLVSIVVAQQVSTASAAAILARLQGAVPDLTVDRMEATSDAVLLGAGLSRPKIRTLRAITAAISDGTLPLDALHEEPAERARTLLTSVTGIGPWTADVYLLFCLGHPDAFPAGDIALQEAARDLLGLDGRPDARRMADLALRWAPLRGVAACVLWAHYRRIRSREGAPRV